MMIEHNIPIPKPNGGKGRKLSAETETALKMKPGDSVYCPTETLLKRISGFFYARKLAHVTRKEGDGYRVWRVDGRKVKKSA